MLPRVALILMSLLSASAVLANPLAGTWKSDRELTLQRLDVDNVAPQHRKTIIEEADLGNAVVEFSDEEYTWTLGEKHVRLPYKVLSIEGHYVEIEYFRTPAATKPTRMRLFVTGDLLYTPIGELNFYEVFRRVSPPADAPE